ncbi:MAG: CPBP family glutamic-type intramembrane protease, partial [Chloroflexota bacterium]
GSWWMPIIPLFLSTLLFCYLYLATRSIWAAVSFHTVANIVFGLVNRGLLVEAAGMDENLMTLVWVQGMVYLVPIVLLHNRIFRVERMAAEV